MRAILLALLLAGVALAGCVGPEQQPTSDAAASGWTIVDTQGQAHTAETTQGAPVLVFFMATWCGSCRATTDDLAQVHQEYAEQGLQMISVTWDPDEDHQDLEAWKERYAQPWPHGVDANFTIHKAYGIRSQSSVIVLDGDSQLVQRWGYGQAEAQSMAEAVEQALGQQA